MTTPTRSRAHALLRLAIRIAPRERAGWIEAMAAEIDHVPDASLQRFAIGCLTTAVRARIASPGFILASAHATLVFGALGWAALNLWFAGRMSSADAAGPEMFGYSIAAAFALGALATARFGFKAVLGLGAPLLAVLGLTALAIKMLLPYSAVNALYFALIVEDIATLLLALGIAFSIPRLVAIRQAARR